MCVCFFCLPVDLESNNSDCWRNLSFKAQLLEGGSIPLETFLRFCSGHSPSLADFKITWVLKKVLFKTIGWFHWPRYPKQGSRVCETSFVWGCFWVAIRLVNSLFYPLPNDLAVALQQAMLVQDQLWYGCYEPLGEYSHGSKICIF